MQKVETAKIEEDNPHPKNVGKWRKLGRDHFGPLALYLVGAVVFTWPLALNLGNRVINPRGSSADVWQHLWNTWWMRFSLLDLHSQPFYSPMIFWPYGANLFFHALDPLDGYISVPLQLIFGLVAAFNLIFLIQITLAGYGACWLARYLTGNYAAAMVAGIIYAFSPLESALLNLGQTELTSIAWLPFFMLFFIKTLERDKRPWLNRTVSVLLLLAMAFVTWYYVLYALLFSGLYLLYYLFRRRKEWRREWPRTILLYAGVLAVWAALVSPLLYLTIRDLNKGGNQQDLWVVAYNSADLLGFVQPGPSAIWGIFGAGASEEYRGNFVGFFGLILALVGVISGWRKNWFWVVFGLVFGLLALGPVLHLNFDSGWNNETATQGLPLPGYLLYNLPFGNVARVPLRFGLGLMLAIAVCAAFGLNQLMNYPRLKRSPLTLKRALPVIAGGLIFLEFLPVPRTLVDTQVPAFYEKLRNEGKWNDFAVLEMPNSATALSMYYQTTGQRPILNAYLSRQPEYLFEMTPGIRELRFLKPDNANERLQILNRDIIDRSTLKNIPAVLDYYRIRYVILHPALLQKTDLVDEPALAQDILGLAFGNKPPTYEDKDLKVWRVPEFDQSKASVDKLLLDFDPGWGVRENGPDNEVLRPVIGTKADLLLFNPAKTPLQITLATMVQSVNQPRLLQVLLNEQNVSKQTMNLTPAKLTLPLTLQPGLNRLTFKTEGEKNRTLLFGFFSIS